MSTKKKENSALIETQHNGVTMILEKKSNGSKAPTPEMQARMEAGKVEIMKVVEGAAGAEQLAELIRMAQTSMPQTAGNNQNKEDMSYEM